MAVFPTKNYVSPLKFEVYTFALYLKITIPLITCNHSESFETLWLAVSKYMSGADRI